MVSIDVGDAGLARAGAARPASRASPRLCPPAWRERPHHL